MEVSPGAAGTALTTLRPSGKARFGDHVVDVVTEGDFIPAETAVAVVSDRRDACRRQSPRLTEQSNEMKQEIGMTSHTQPQLCCSARE